jgi:hypothetical protein
LIAKLKRNPIDQMVERRDLNFSKIRRILLLSAVLVFIDFLNNETDVINSFELKN